MNRVALVSLLLGLLGLGLCAWAAVDDVRRCAAGWLLAWTWCFTIAVGALGAVMLIEACGGHWHVVIRRGAEGLYAMLPALALLFLPIGFTVRSLYPWAAATPSPRVAELIAVRSPLQTVPAFYLRSLIYLLALVVIAGVLRAISRRMDGADEPMLARRHRAWCCAGLPVYGIALTGAALDWLMSLDAVFASTVFPAWIYAGGVLGAVGAWTMAIAVAQPRLRLPLTTEHFVALGRLQLAFVVFTAYLAFSQLLVVSMGDLPHEVTWYRTRFVGSWGVLGATMAIAHYALPFLALLSLRLKHVPWLLASVGGWLAATHYADLYWALMPSLYPQGIPWHWCDAAALLAVGGLAGAYACRRLRRYAPMPLHDARLTASLRYEARIA